MSAPRPEMVPLPAGWITLRDARTDTTRDVELLSFSIARTPVTRVQFAAVRGERVVDDQLAGAPVHSVSWLEAASWCNAVSNVSGLSPAYTISGTDVTWDVSAEGFRLPTEAEWEWACRGGTTGPRYGPLREIAWTADDGIDGPQQVGIKRPNSFGVFDTLGNVWEWCWDYVDTARYADYRTLRGGGWADKHWSTRASVRRGSMPGAQLDDVGFRLAQGGVGDAEDHAAQGWSHQADLQRGALRGQTPFGWTPLGPSR